MTACTVEKTFPWQGRITPKVQAVMRMFGVDVNRLAETAPRHKCTIEINPGEIVFITGPSGSGKSVLLREMMTACRGEPVCSPSCSPPAADCGCPPVEEDFKPPVNRPACWARPRPQAPKFILGVKAPKGRDILAQGKALGDRVKEKQALKGRDNTVQIIDLDSINLSRTKAVIDCIDGNFITALETLSIVGLSDVFAVLNTPAHLSEGQKYRFKLAKGISSGADLIFADEFCSNLDRITAASIAYQIRKFASRHNAAFVLASSREDILADLQPDVLIIKHLNGKTEVIYKSRGNPCGCPKALVEGESLIRLGGLIAPGVSLGEK